LERQRQANVFTIPASAPFLGVLIDALCAGRLVPAFPASDNPLALAQATLFLPTRRACRKAREIFLDRLGRDAAILPRIVPLGDIDEDEIAFADIANPDALALPEALDPLERPLTLAQMVAAWANATTPERGAPLVANTPAAAIALADDLARLMDDMTTREVPWENLSKLVPDDLDKHWQLSLDFLKFVYPRWREFLAGRGVMEPAERRDRLIEAETRRLQNSNAPVIAAGSTGSMPSTAKLLAAIARLQQGAVVLPGLDLTLDEPSWQRIAGAEDDATHDGVPASGHPQFAMQALLTRIGITRSEVEPLARTPVREALVCEALRPAATTEHWRESRVQMAAQSPSALDGLGMIEAANAEQESLAIAVSIREVLEQPGKSVALVTPDRALARRVVAALARWDIAADDSGGVALAETSAGRLARLAARAALNELDPVMLLALLKHPLTQLDAPAGSVSVLERAILRGPRPKPGTSGLVHALATFRATRDGLHPSDPRKWLSDAELDAAEQLVRQLASALAPLEALPRRDHPLASLAAAHREALAALSSGVFDGHDGTALARALDELAVSAAAALLAIAPSDYAEIFVAAVGDRVVRRPETRDVRVHIYGPLEARLQPADRVILGGLNEGTWPPETRSDLWLSRPMRRQLGLDPPERRIGLAAHDFAQLMGHAEVVLTRAQKVGGAPTVTSRFVQRLAALAGAENWKQVTRHGEELLAFARALDEPAQVTPALRPAPKPPVAARPTKLSVTAIEDWLRDPYTIYAKYILRLPPLDPIDTPPGVRDRGTLIHGAIGDYTEKFASGIPADPLAELRALGERHFGLLKDYPEARAFWWPRFERSARWFVQWDTERRKNIAELFAEIRGELKFNMGAGEFTLSGIADRIERLSDGRYAILDYKTGQARSEPQVRTGLAPQLTLESALVAAGAFKDVPAGSVAEIMYVTLRGGEPAGESCPINFKDGTPDSQAEHALARLKGLAAKFANADTPYYSLVHPMWTTHYGDYDHLARVKEWSLSGVEHGE
jgi:ATP-dependent helicase/nuclease subunit B